MAKDVLLLLLAVMELDARAEVTVLDDVDVLEELGMLLTNGERRWLSILRK